MMLEKRGDRALILIGVLGALAGVFFGPQFSPGRFNHETEVGVVQGNSPGDTSRDVNRHSMLSEPAWKDAAQRCVEGTVREESLKASGMDVFYSGTGFTDRLICTTHSDRRKNLVSYAIAALLIPLLILLGRFAAVWILRGERSGAHV